MIISGQKLLVLSNLKLYMTPGLFRIFNKKLGLRILGPIFRARFVYPKSRVDAIMDLFQL